MAKKEPQQQQKKSYAWVYVIAILGVLWIMALFFVGCVSLFVGGDSTPSFGAGNVALIPVKGVIVGDSDSGFFAEDADSQAIVELIEQAAADDSIKAIIIEINSPGGSPVASDEIALALKKANKTTVAWMREVAASGGYWIGSATDHIVANRMTITGSIGVVAAYLEFGGLLDRYNISYERMVAGKYKDLGSPFRELTPQERIIFQRSLDDLHDFFIEEVAQNRGMTEQEVRKSATGLWYLGSEALELGLVDELGGKAEVIAYIESVEGIEADIVEYETVPGLFDILAASLDKSFYFMGQGLGSSLKETRPQSVQLYT